MKNKGYRFNFNGNQAITVAEAIEINEILKELIFLNKIGLMLEKCLHLMIKWEVVSM